MLEWGSRVGLESFELLPVWAAIDLIRFLCIFFRCLGLADVLLAGLHFGFTNNGVQNGRALLSLL